MDRLRRLAAHSLALTLGAVVGTAGIGVAAATAASDYTTEVSGSCGWDPDTDGWVVTWSVTGLSPDGTGSYRLTEVAAMPEDVDGIAATESDFPHPAGDVLTGTQQLPAEATEASLTVQAAWESGEEDGPRHAEVTIPADCELPELPAVSSASELRCDVLAITIDNPTDDGVVLTFSPSTGTAFPVEVGGGESATVELPASAGLTVDVLFQGRSILDLPVEVGSAELADQDCDEGGSGGDLPATGLPLVMVAIGAAALLGLGFGLYLVARRRRITFTA